MLTCRSRPNRSGEPRRSISDGRPAAPIATPQVPRRQARPKLSLMITATGTPNFSDRRLLNIAALPSGSSGNSSARWASSGEATLDWSMPALAITKPSRCSTIRTPGLARTTRTDSDRISSTRRGSFWTLRASAIASVEGSTVASSTMRPSALDTIFCVSTKTSPPNGTMPSRASPSSINATRSSFLRTSGMPGTANISTALLRVIGRSRSAEPLAKPRQHVLAVEFQEAHLVRSRRVEHQIPEAETDIVTDPLDMLVGVAGHDPSAGGALQRQRVGKALHLDGILDRHLLLWRQRQRRPVARVLERTPLIGIERHLDLDHAIVGPRRILRRCDSLGDLRQQRLGVELRPLAAGADEPFRGAASVTRHEGARGCDIDRHRRIGAVVDRRLLGLVVLAFEADPLLSPERSDQRDGLAQAGEALLEFRPWLTGRRHFIESLAGADAEHDASREHRAHRAERLGDDGRMVAESRRQHAGPHDHARRSCAQRAEPRERERRMAVDVLPRLKVVADEDRVEADFLGKAREAQQLVRRELLRRGLVSELD